MNQMNNNQTLCTC